MDLIVRYPSRTVSIIRSQAIVPVSFWVRAADAVMKVAPSSHNIYDLKKAVKAELEFEMPGFHVNAFTMQVKKHDGTVCDVMDARLEANTEETAYVITLP
jgi:hypothetical protein